MFFEIILIRKLELSKLHHSFTSPLLLYNKKKCCSFLISFLSYEFVKNHCNSARTYFFIYMYIYILYIDIYIYILVQSIIKFLINIFSIILVNLTNKIFYFHSGKDTYFCLSYYTQWILFS